jgi:hypothetical protein
MDIHVWPQVDESYRVQPHIVVDERQTCSGWRGRGQESGYSIQIYSTMISSVQRPFTEAWPWFGLQPSSSMHFTGTLHCEGFDGSSIGGTMSALSASLSSRFCFWIACMSSYNWPICWSAFHQHTSIHAQVTFTYRSSCRSWPCPSWRLSTYRPRAFVRTVATQSGSQSWCVSRVT